MLAITRDPRIPNSRRDIQKERYILNTYQSTFTAGDRSVRKLGWGLHLATPLRLNCNGLLDIQILYMGADLGLHTTYLYLWLSCLDTRLSTSIVWAVANMIKLWHWWVSNTLFPLKFMQGSRGVVWCHVFASCFFFFFSYHCSCPCFCSVIKPIFHSMMVRPGSDLDGALAI